MTQNVTVRKIPIQFYANQIVVHGQHVQAIEFSQFQMVILHQITMKFLTKIVSKIQYLMKASDRKTNSGLDFCQCFPKGMAPQPSRVPSIPDKDDSMPL